MDNYEADANDLTVSPILLIAVFLIAFTLALLLYLRISEYFEFRTTLGFIPGPKTFPFIGLSWKIASVPYEERFQWFNNLCFKFKKGMVVTWFGAEPMVNIRKPHQIQIILSNGRVLTKSRIYNITTPWLGDGLLTSTGDTWYDHRRLIKSAFTSDILEEYVNIMHKKVEILVECLCSKVKAKPKAPVNIFNLAVKYALDTISEMAIGIDMDIQRKSDNLYLRAFRKFSRISAERYFRFWMQSDTIFYLTNAGKTLLNFRKRIHELTDKYVIRNQIAREEKKLKRKEETAESGPHKPKSFLDVLLDSCENNHHPLSIRATGQEVDSFIFAGYNPTSAAISWTLFSLGNAPKIQAKLHEELSEIFGKNNEAATPRQLEQLQYLDRVIKEALRLYPSVPTISRFLDLDTVIDFCFIPRETILNIQIYQLHHDPEVWEDPEVFDPDRFLPENSNERHPYAYIPFSAGARECIGQKLALLEIKIALVAILRKWYVSSVLKPNEITLVSNFILKPHDDNIELYLTPINNVYN